MTIYRPGQGSTDEHEQMAAVNRSLGREEIATAQEATAAAERAAAEVAQPAPPSLWDEIVGSEYRQLLLDYGNANSSHGPDQDERMPDAALAARAAAVAELARETGVSEWDITQLAREAAHNHGYAPDADYIDYLAEPHWTAVQDGTYQARDPWASTEPDWDDSADDEFTTFGTFQSDHGDDDGDDDGFGA